ACPRIGLVLRESGFEIVFAVFSGESFDYLTGKSA
ncbi:MAG: hypothetical protein ACI9FJ_000902, partial [Alteromonadaceae bacterium]